MNKWYMQIAVGLVGIFILSFLGNAIYPESLYKTTDDIIQYAEDTRAFYIIAVLSLVINGLIIVGLVRGLLVLIRKFRSFVRIPK